jgi:hypothetical protein
MITLQKSIKFLGSILPTSDSQIRLVVEVPFIDALEKLV